MHNMILYILLSIFSLLLILYFIYKIKYPFWSRQPVFHYHNLFYWIKPPGIIQMERPEINKFYNSKITFKQISNLNQKEKDRIVDFIKKHYLPHLHEKYEPNEKAIIDYFNAHNNKSFISMNYLNNLYKNNLISMMTTRPLDISLKDNFFSLYYVDYLCVHQDYRKKGNAPLTIYSHYYNQRYNHDNIIFLFKREGEKTAIVPLTTYNTYAFEYKILSSNLRIKEKNIVVLEINNKNIDLFLSLLQDCKTKFDCVINPYIGNINYLIENKHMFVYVLMNNEQPMGFYIFKNSYTKYFNDLSIEFNASYNKTNPELFLKGFFTCLDKLQEYIKFNIILLENTSDNNYILNHLMKYYIIKFESMASYYLYNYASYPIENYKVLCIN